MAIYQWKESARFTADVGLVGQELENIAELVPEKIVEFAENETTELHKCFTWDDSEAAHKFRLHEARQVVSCVLTVDLAEEKEPIIFRAFESVVIDDKRQYVPTRKILTDDNLKDQVFKEIFSAIGELSAKAKTYRFVAEKELDQVQYYLDLAKEPVRT